MVNPLSRGQGRCPIILTTMPAKPIATPPQAVQQTRLRPVYSALDNHNYTKALKLTSVEAKNEPLCHWDLTKALRIIALDRSGRKREALGLLRDVLGADCYDELEDKIVQMDVGLPVVTKIAKPAASAGGGGGGGGKSKGKKGKGKKTHAAPAPQVSDTVQVDYVDLLDVSSWKRRMERREKSLADGNNESKANVFTDDVVLATLKVTLLSQRLNVTLAQLFARAADALSSNPNANKEELCSILQESYFSHIRLACTYQRTAHVLDPMNVSEKHVCEAEQIASAYECAQLAAMTLARHTGSRLHQSWVANAALLHREANVDAVVLMEAKLSQSSNDNDSSIGQLIEKMDKLRAKASMLPRLAESLMSRVVSREDNNDSSKDAPKDSEHPPSAEDWNLYIQTLVEQDKLSDALEKLEGINACGSSVGKEGDLRRIDDQTDLASHEGSLIQLAHRSRLEQKASLCLKLERYDEARETYTELISLLPDNWSYWIGFLQSSICFVADEEQVENGIMKCQQAVEAYITSDTTSLRGPHLFRVELAAIPVRGIETDEDGKTPKQDISKFLNKESSQQEILVRNLGQAIIDYAAVFASKASCCFNDLRKYIELFATACYELKEEANVWEELLKLLEWAKTLREENGFQQVITDAKERRKRLRSYICSIQISFGVLHIVRRRDKSGDANESESLDSFLPDMSDMVNEWRMSLDLGSNPKAGGQKEVLPGDELILLACQYGRNDGSSKSFLIAAAALLEGALHHSPYNPHLKIAGIDIYNQLSAGQRAAELFDDMGVKQIQYDSCSYLIFQSLISTGLYREAVQLAGNVMGLHWSSAKDVQDYAIKCCETGMLSKCREMITWQRERMTNSLQLLASKITVMDLASLVYSGEPDERGKTSTEPLGARQGLCGGEHDFDRVGELINNIGNNSAAPSIVNVALGIPTVNTYADNRDFTVNQFHILSESQYMSKEDVCLCAFTQAHLQGVLMRAVLLVNVVKAPKKGKVTKVKEDDILYKRCRSLFNFLDIVDAFLKSSSNQFAGRRNESDYASGRAVISLGRVLCTVSTGMYSNISEEVDDSLAEREKQASLLLKEVKKDIDAARKSLLSATPVSSGRACMLLPEAVVPIFALMEMTSILFAIFGWGKRKRHKKPAADALADAAEELQDLAMDMLGALVSIPTDAPADESPGNICSYLESEEGKEMLEAVSKHVERSHIETRQRVMPFLDQIIQTLETYAAETS